LRALGLYSIPADRPGMKVYVSVVRMLARGIWLAIARKLAVHRYSTSSFAPLTARPSPGQSGQEGTVDAPSTPTLP
jgi:hypothetical protein